MKGWACVARLGGLGDNLVAASVCRPLKKMGYDVEVITTEKEYHVVFHNNPFIDKLTLKGEGDIPGGPDWQKWFESRAKEYDVFAHLSHSMEVRHALFPDSTPFRWPVEYRRKMCAGSYLETAHDIAQVPYDFGPMFFPTEEEKANADELKKKVGGKFLAWVISGSRFDKVWPYAPAAIPRIIKELNIPVILVGIGHEQAERAEACVKMIKISNSTRDMLHVACPQHASGNDRAQHWGIRPSIALTMAADLVVSPDTGLAWACAMEPMPKVIMVSHASAENITKHWVNTTTLHADQNRVPCWPCHRLHNGPETCVPMENMPAASCMGDISVEAMMKAVDNAWTEREIAATNVVPLRAAE